MQRGLALLLLLFLVSSLLLAANNNVLAELKASRLEGPPIAIAKKDLTAVSGTTMILNGTGSYDPDGDKIVRYRWNQLGSPRVSLSGANSPTPSFTIPSITFPVDMTFKLTVNDGKHDSVPIEVVVHVIPQVHHKSTLTFLSGMTSLNNTAIADGRRTATKGGPISTLHTTNTVGVKPRTADINKESNNINLKHNVTLLQQIPFFPSQQQQQPSPSLGPAAGFMAKGTINSLINTPRTKWIATGNWTMNVDNGSLTSFNTNMTWFNSNGAGTHTHEFRDFKSNKGQIITLQQPGNNVVLKGVMDVGTNHRVVWKSVPTTISINGEKTITIAVDNQKTNFHFAGQPIFGITTSFIPCSDVPGPNMEVLPPCM